jgi:hypothetical protein
MEGFPPQVYAHRLAVVRMSSNSSQIQLGPTVNSLLASLSFGSDTVYMAGMYVIIDPEVEQNGSLEMESP